MDIFDILLLAVAVSMDATAVGMTDGMADPKMPIKKVLLIAAFFGLFQAAMPLVGYFVTKLVAGCLSLLLSESLLLGILRFVGAARGKMIFDCVREMRSKKRGEAPEPLSSELSAGRLALQAVATSIDALAIGVTLQMAELSVEGLFPPVGWAVFIIGAVTFALVVPAVYIGKLIGDKLADRAELIGGIVLVGIGVKLLLEGIL